jgi:hypothetical protein
VEADDERAAGAHGARHLREHGAPAGIVEIGECDVPA